MKTRTVSLAAAAGLFLAPLLAGSPAAQQPPQPQAEQARPTSEQVNVPAGREGGQGRQGGGRRGGGRQAGPPPAPAPRTAEGKMLLGGATSKEPGVWIGGNLGQRHESVMQPWALALSADRRSHMLEPHTRCKASGIARQFLTPYGAEIVEIAELKRIYIFDIGGPHTFRTIYMDGRSHPRNLPPTYYGHSIGWWEGDTLVVDSTGFNETFWMDRGASPHTEQLHTVERFTRTDAAAMRYELTADDPGAYTKPWTATMNLRYQAGTELFEYICQQQNYAHELMVGEYDRVDRTTLPVP
jgi:hypothetical protein